MQWDVTLCHISVVYSVDCQTCASYTRMIFWFIFLRCRVWRMGRTPCCVWTSWRRCTMSCSCSCMTSKLRCCAVRRCCSPLSCRASAGRWPVRKRFTCWRLQLAISIYRTSAYKYKMKHICRVTFDLISLSGFNEKQIGFQKNVSVTFCVHLLCCCHQCSLWSLFRGKS